MTVLNMTASADNRNPRIRNRYDAEPDNLPDSSISQPDQGLARAFRCAETRGFEGMRGGGRKRN